MMPELDGYEVCRRLKADPRTRDMPVMFLTALSQPEDETRGFEVGGADFIHKPFNAATVLARVRTHLQLKAWHDALQRPQRLAAVRARARGWPRSSGCATPPCS